MFTGLPKISRWLYSLAIAAFILKVLLQFFSVHPELGQLAFGYRAIIIGYLHLIFLAFITMYLLGYVADTGIVVNNSRIGFSGLAIFAAGIIINEVFLAVQGVASIFYIATPDINMLLFYNTFILCVGATLIFLGAVKTSTKENNKTFHY